MSITALLIVMTPFAALVGVFGKRKGHSFVACFLGSLIFTPIIMALCVAAMKDLKAERERRMQDIRISQLMRRNAPPRVNRAGVRMPRPRG